MTKEKFLKILNNTLDKINSLFDSKNKEYAGEKDVFANFKKASSGISFHRKPEQVAWEYMTKHLQSIKDLIENGNYSNSSLVDEKIDDTIVYLLLIKGMIKENQDLSEMLDKLIHREEKTDDNHPQSYKYYYTNKPFKGK